MFELDAGRPGAIRRSFRSTGCSKELEQPSQRGSQRERPGYAHCSVQRMGAHRPHSAGARIAELCFRCGALHPGGRARWLSTSRRNARYRSLGHRAWSCRRNSARKSSGSSCGARRSRRERTTWAWPGTGDRPEALRSDGVAEIRNQHSGRGSRFSVRLPRTLPGRTSRATCRASPHHRHLGAARCRGGRR